MNRPKRKSKGGKAAGRRDKSAVMVRLEPELAAYLESAAADANVSLSGFVESVLQALSDLHDDATAGGLTWEEYGWLLLTSLGRARVTPQAIEASMRDELREMLQHTASERLVRRQHEGRAG